MRERNEIRRPNPNLSVEEMAAASTGRRGSRRRARQARQARNRLLLGLFIVFGALILLGMLFFLFHAR